MYVRMLGACLLMFLFLLPLPAMSGVHLEDSEPEESPQKRDLPKAVAEQEERALSLTELRARLANAAEGEVLVLAQGVHVWEGQGPALVVSGLDKVTIRAEGSALILEKKTQGKGDPLLLVENSRDISLENLCLARDDQSGAEGPAAVSISGSRGVSLLGCVLHGPGLTGLLLRESDDVLLRESVLTGFSRSAVSVERGNGLLLEDCLLADNRQSDRDDSMDGAFVMLDRSARIDFHNNLIVRNAPAFLALQGDQGEMRLDDVSGFRQTLPKGVMSMEKTIFADNGFDLPGDELSEDKTNITGRVGSVCTSDLFLLVHLPGKPGPRNDEAVKRYHEARKLLGVVREQAQ